MPLPMKGMLIAFLALNTSPSHHLPLLAAGLSCLIEKGIDLKHPDTAFSHVCKFTDTTDFSQYNAQYTTNLFLFKRIVFDGNLH